MLYKEIEVTRLLLASIPPPPCASSKLIRCQSGEKEVDTLWEPYHGVPPAGHRATFPGVHSCSEILGNVLSTLFSPLSGALQFPWFQALSLGALRWPCVSESQARNLRVQILPFLGCHLKRHHDHLGSFSTCVFNLDLLCG